MSGTPNFRAGLRPSPGPRRCESALNPEPRSRCRAKAQSRALQFFRLTPVEAAVVLGFFAYAALFIYKSSFTIGGVRYFSLFDDDMISMRYAANLANHHGLV
jgi:hypothetical protein